MAARAGACAVTPFAPTDADLARIDRARAEAWHKTQQGAPAWPADEASAADFTKWLFEGDTTARFSGWVQKNGGK